MHALSAQCYFVVGTDTNVGKTYISAQLIDYFVAQNKLTVGMKPVASGCDLNADDSLINEDARILIAASNIKVPMDLMNPYRFVPAIAPHIAAEQSGVVIDLNVIHTAFTALREQAEVVIVEGAGGFLVPLNDRENLADLAVRLNLPIILVVGMRLGCINHALLTVEVIKARGLTLSGWIANEIVPDMPMFDENLTTLCRHILAPCLSVVRWQQASL